MGMNTRVKRLWTAALRSGEYEQGTSGLRVENAHCCLGVLCEVAVREGVIERFGPNVAGDYSYGTGRQIGDSRTADLPREVVRWAGLKEADPIIKPEVLDNGQTCGSLIVLNDVGKAPFSTIADVIDRDL